MKKILMFLFALVLAIDSFATGISGASAPCDNATLSKYNGTADIEINWEPNTIGLKWFNGDQQVAGPTSCVYDSTLSVPPQPTKPGYTFNGWKVWKITVPDGYTQLEYLQSNNADFQYIDMGYIISSYTKVYLTFESFNAGWLFGGSIGESGRWGAGVEGGGKLTFYSEHDAIFDVANYNVNGKNTALFDYGRGVTMNGVFSGFSSNLSYGIYNGKKFYLFFADGSSVITHKRIYEAKIYLGDDLIHNLIPARRNSDGVLGMFDTVSGRFFTNSGTGSFVAGPVAN